MPQMEFADYAPQLVWLLITFGVLYFLIARFSLPKISEVLEAREQKIVKDIEQAEVLNKQAETASIEFDRIAEKSRLEAKDIASKSREKLKTEQETKMHQLEEKLANESLELEEKINQARDKAISELRDLASDLGRTTASKLLGNGH